MFELIRSLFLRPHSVKMSQPRNDVHLKTFEFYSKEIPFIHLNKQNERRKFECTINCVYLFMCVCVHVNIRTYFDVVFRWFN